MFNHILVPVAPSHISGHGHAMAAAKKLLTPDGKTSVLSVLEAVPTYAEIQLPTNYLTKNMADVTAGLKAELGSDGAEIKVIHGHSARSILDWAQENDVDCIAMSSHLPGFSDFFIGSTAAKVVRHAKCSVVVLR